MKSCKRLHRTLLLWQLLLALVLLDSTSSLSAGAEPSSLTPVPAGAPLSMSLAKSRLYPGESTTLTVVLWVREGEIRNIGYPALDHAGVKLGEFAPPRQREARLDDAVYTSYEFIAPVTPQRSGTLRLGPARMSGEVHKPSSGAAGFFGESTPAPVSFAAPPLSLTVLPFPAQGKPPGFRGAVGSFTLRVAAKPTTLQVGDPLTVTTAISGVGNLAIAMCPQLAPGGFKVYPVRGSLAPGRLTCEQVLIPEAVSSRLLPPASFSSFDPSDGSYHTLRSEAIPLALAEKAPAVKAAVTMPPASAAPPRRQSPLSWLWLLLPLPLAAAVPLLRRIRPRPRRSPSIDPQPRHSGQRDISQLLRTAEEALARHDVERFYNAVFRAAKTMIDEKHAINAQAGPSPLKVPDSRSFGALEEITQLFGIVVSCDAVRYGCHQPTEQEMQLLLNRLNSLF
jgi:hypothetical protein